MPKKPAATGELNDREISGIVAAATAKLPDGVRNLLDAHAARAASWNTGAGRRLKRQLLSWCTVVEGLHAALFHAESADDPRLAAALDAFNRADFTKADRRPIVDAITNGKPAAALDLLEAAMSSLRQRTPPPPPPVTTTDGPPPAPQPILISAVELREIVPSTKAHRGIKGTPSKITRAMRKQGIQCERIGKRVYVTADDARRFCRRWPSAGVALEKLLANS